MNTTTSMLIPQNTQNLTKQGYDTTEDNPIDSNSTLAANNLAIILVLSITPVGLVLLISSIILVVIPAGTWSKCHQDLTIIKFMIFLCYSLQKEIKVNYNNEIKCN